MDITKWFHMVGLISAVALGIGFVAALVSVGLSWRINQQQEKELEQIKGDVAKQQERAATAEKALLELQERIKGRHLTKEQRVKLFEILKAGPKGMITFEIFIGDQEAGTFRDEIADVLYEAGWEILPGTQSIQPPPKALGLYMLSATEPSFAGFLQNALKEIGLDAQGVIKPVSKDIVTLFVGPNQLAVEDDR